MLCEQIFLICPSGMYGFQQAARLPQYVPPQYAPTPSLQAAGNMADPTGQFSETLKFLA